MDGSSSTYKTPVNREPICVASRMRCASPPDNVPAARVNVKYSKPTLSKNSRRSLISFKIEREFAYLFLKIEMLRK